MLIRHREAEGHTGVNDPVLHELNCEQTNRRSDQELIDTVRERESRGLGAGKARAALRARGVELE
jgi:hypothetical protein